MSGPDQKKDNNNSNNKPSALSHWIQANKHQLSSPVKRRSPKVKNFPSNHQDPPSPLDSPESPNMPKQQANTASSPTNPNLESSFDKASLSRTKSLSRPERRPESEKTGGPGTTYKRVLLAPDDPTKFQPWTTFCKVLTCLIPSALLEKMGGMHSKEVQQAWREKIGLVFICSSMMLALGFLTFGLTSALCTHPEGIAIKWEEVEDTSSGKKLMAFNGHVLDMTNYLAGDVGSSDVPRTDELVDIVTTFIGRDATRKFASTPELRSIAETFVANDSLLIGNLQIKPLGCHISDTILYLSLIIILAVIIVRFVFAIYFSWFISHQLGKLKQKRSRLLPFLQQKRRKKSEKNNSPMISEHAVPTSEYTEEVYTMLLVTCYSEDQEGIQTTMNSLASTIYNDSKKLLFLVADGQITGSGNSKSTPDLILELLELDPKWDTSPKSYIAISEGSKRHNMARVYAGYYTCDGHRVPTILISKCGTPAEAQGAKPGNRGKRDSQIILMSFFQKVTLDEPMTPLEYDMFIKMHYLMGVTPDRFEIVLMVDADTRVEPDSLSRMVACMVRDPDVIGLCGETRIMNKSESWVSAIQVFEYYLSHHLAKAFESIFGGVTCLPGCFCMWRIKTPKGNGFWVPIICNPDIVNTYSENVVDTLHKKNLLLLGEDRFLTTIMLKHFPQRKTMFVPAAFCKTTVPAQFKVLLSQRRRWINSTIHNLMELVLVRELCGVFCFSMQFVIFLELVGTVTLPAAISFTTYLIIISFIISPPPIIPLALLAAILGLPAVLILLTTKRVSYVYWMGIYLCALPIWNFVLPSYAFWHFDDFSWGDTRKVEGEVKGDDHSGSDGKKSDEIPSKRWLEWEKERRSQMSRLPPASSSTTSFESTSTLNNNIKDDQCSVKSNSSQHSKPKDTIEIVVNPTSKNSNPVVKGNNPPPKNNNPVVKGRSSTTPQKDTTPPPVPAKTSALKPALVKRPAISKKPQPKPQPKPSVKIHDNASSKIQLDSNHSSDETHQQQSPKEKQV